MYDEVFYDLNEVGQNLLEVVQQLGEDVYFTMEDGTKKYTKMCVSDNVTSANPNSVKSYHATGEMIFENYSDMELLRGNYFYKASNPSKTYILISTTENPFTDKVATIEILECNKTIDIGYEVAEKEHGNTYYRFEPYFTDVKVFASTDIKTPQSTKVGELPKTITTISLPCEYVVTSEDVIRIKEFQRDKKTHELSFSYQTYDVLTDSVNTDLMTSYDEDTHVGVISFDVIKKP